MPQLTTTSLGRFCRELAGGLDDISVLLKEWDTTPEEFLAIQGTPAFQHEMKQVQMEMQVLGNDAGYVYRMKSLSESLLPELVVLLKDAATGPGLKFEMIKWVAEMARLKEKAPMKGDDDGRRRGPMVVFQFGAGLPVKSMTVQAEDTDRPHEIMGEAQEMMRLPQSEPPMEWPT